MRRLLVLADTIGFILAALLVELIFGNSGSPDALSFTTEVGVFLLSLPVFLVGARLFGLYDRDEERADHSTADDLVGVFLLFTVGVFFVESLSGLTAVADPDVAKLTAFWALGIAAVTLGRTCARTIGRRSLSYLQNTVVVGADQVGQLLARKLLAHHEYGLNLVGFVDRTPWERVSHLDHVPVLGGLDALPGVVRDLDVERVIFTLTGDDNSDFLPLIRRMREANLQVDLVPRFFEVIGPNIDIHTVEGVSVIGLPPVKPSRSSRGIKRAVDVVGAALCLIVLAPLFAFIAIRIKLDSAGPVLFRQTRLGQGMSEFSFLKFRTMKSDTDQDEHQRYIEGIVTAAAEPSPNGIYKLDRSAAVTSSGAWLRKRSLDELPQLVNVLRGEMSLVGPRPCLPYEVEHFAPHHFERFHVPQGMTGLWQVSARAHSTFVEALDMDVLYAQSASLGLDLALLARTPLQLVRPQGTA